MLRPSFSPISQIKQWPTTMATSNAEIGAVLLENFFSPLLPYFLPAQAEISNNAGLSTQLTAPPLQKEDVQAAIFKASPLKALGQDNIPALIWQKLWLILDGHILSLFCESLRQRKLPK